MLTPSDILHLPYIPDLTEGGITYACRSLAYTYNRMGGSSFDRLRRIAGGVAVELAFRRYLSERGIPFDVLGATPFTDPDHYDVSLGGHRCDIKSFLLTRREQIRAVRSDPGALLAASALIPMDQFVAEDHTSQDIYLFAFLLALTASSQEDVQKALDAGQPVYFIHPMPEDWARPKVWQPLEKLALKSECEAPITVEVGGQDAERNFVVTSLTLPPKTRLAVEQPFYSVAYLHAQQLPPARIGIHCPLRGEVHLIHRHEWGNIWVYGMDILLAGYLSREDFRRKAHVLPAGNRTFQYDQTRTKNLALPVAELQPLAPLFEKVKEWGASQKAEDNHY
jgi:hypothetical protein